MPWFSSTPAVGEANLPNYGSVASHAIDENSAEVVPAGIKARYISISVAADADPIYVGIGAAVDVSTKTYNFILPASFENNKMEISAQSVHMATASAGKTANVLVAVAE
jgi:hypothetical protein